MANMRRWGILQAVFFLSICCFSLAFAADYVDDNFSHSADTYLRYFPARRVEAMPGKVGVVETSVGYSYDFKAFDQLPVKFTIEPGYIGIDSTVDVELPSCLTSLVADIETTLPFFDFADTYFRMGFSPSFYGDDWDFEASQFRMPSRYFLIHRANDALTLVAGIGVYPDFQMKAGPIIAVIYQPNERLEFRISPKRPRVSYIFNDMCTLFLEGGGHLGSEYEVSKDDFKNVVLRYKVMTLGTGVKVKFNENIQAQVSVGGAFNRQFKYLDSLGKVNLKSDVYTEIRLEMRI